MLALLDFLEDVHGRLLQHELGPASVILEKKRIYRLKTALLCAVWLLCHSLCGQKLLQLLSVRYVYAVHTVGVVYVWRGAQRVRPLAVIVVAVSRRAARLPHLAALAVPDVLRRRGLSVHAATSNSTTHFILAAAVQRRGALGILCILRGQTVPGLASGKLLYHR